MYGWLPFLAVCPFFADSPLLFLPSFLSSSLLLPTHPFLVCCLNPFFADSAREQDFWYTSIIIHPVLSRFWVPTWCPHTLGRLKPGVICGAPCCWRHQAQKATFGDSRRFDGAWWLTWRCYWCLKLFKHPWSKINTHTITHTITHTYIYIYIYTHIYIYIHNICIYKHIIYYIHNICICICMNILEDDIDDINLHQPTAIWRGFFPGWFTAGTISRPGKASPNAKRWLSSKPTVIGTCGIIWMSRIYWWMMIFFYGIPAAAMMMMMMMMMRMMMIIEADLTEHFLAIPRSLGPGFRKGHAPIWYRWWIFLEDSWIARYFLSGTPTCGWISQLISIYKRHYYTTTPSGQIPSPHFAAENHPHASLPRPRLCG